MSRFCHVCAKPLPKTAPEGAIVHCPGQCNDVLAMACEAINQKKKENQDMRERLMALLRHRRQCLRLPC
jgi:hypothetical protein